MSNLFKLNESHKHSKKSEKTDKADKVDKSEKLNKSEAKINDVSILQQEKSNHILIEDN